MPLNRFAPGVARVATAASLLAVLAGAASAATHRATSMRPIEAPVLQAGPHDSKVDPALRMLAARWTMTQSLAAGRPRLDAETRLMRATTHVQVAREEDGGPLYVTTFVKLTDPSAARLLEQDGARITTQVGDIAIVRLPIASVGAVAARPEVLSLQASKLTPALLDSSRIRSKVKDVHDGSGGLPQSYKGDGVVVGVLDSGIDYTHPDFKTAGGLTRIKGMYDYSFGTHGREWSPGSIDSATSTEYDGTGGGGHGTHVSGTAAGNGRGNAAYVGMAPNSDIVFVKGMRDTASSTGFADADVVAGCQFIFNKARALNEPCVINLSLGGQFGAHDGTSLYEQALDQLTHPGNIIVAAAGNSGQDFIHLGYAAPPGTSYAESFETPLLVLGSSAGVDIWYPASGNIRFGVAVYDNGDLSTAVAVTAAIAPGGTLAPLVVTDGVKNYGTVTIDALTTADPNNGKRNVQIAIEDAPGGTASDYIWAIYAVGTGTFDGWCVFGGAFPPQSFFTNLGIAVPSYFRLGNNDKTIGTPATARKLIAVGSYVTKTQWVDVNGVTEVQPGATLDALSGFSSLGPSGDDRSLPHLAAPGEAIVAAMAASVAATTPQSDIALGGGYKKLQGTSMASPHVTGVVALMLQKNPFLTPENARALLQASATPAGTPNTFGAGRLNALAAMLAVPDPIACGPIPLSNSTLEDCDQSAGLDPGSLQVRPNPAVRAATLAFRLSSAEQVDLAVYDLAGRRVRTIQSGLLVGGTHQSVWDGTNDHGAAMPSGVYFTRLWTPKRTAVERLVMIK